MNYAAIISDFTWSYSRIGQFEMCPYAFLLKYILRTPSKHLFFSDYGSFIHKLMEEYLNGNLGKQDLAGEYLRRFRQEVQGTAPNEKIFKSYFEQGFNYLTSLDFPYPDPLCVEQRIDFTVGSNKFIGIVDCILRENNEYMILDHKSRTLKERSGRKKPTRSDGELDRYLRQLYLYAAAVKEVFGSCPKYLIFNCFRAGIMIREPFCVEDFIKAQDWAEQMIERITNNEDWSPQIDYWKCRYICDLHDACEYFAMNR